MKLTELESSRKLGCAFSGKVKLLLDLRRMRIERGITLRQIEAATGLANAIWSQVERGKSPSIETALRIASFVETPIEKIWALNGKRKAKVRE